MGVEHTPIRQIRPELPDAIDVVLSRALAKEKESRFQTALEFQRELDGALRAGHVRSLRRGPSAARCPPRAAPSRFS